MKKPVFILCFCLLHFGAVAQQRALGYDKSFPGESTSSIDPNAIILVTLGNGISVRWSNEFSGIVHDNLWKTAVKNFRLLQPFITWQIMDRTPTGATSCTDKGLTLVKGDIAYAFINSIIDLPLFLITGVQCDVMAPDCGQMGYYHAVGVDRANTTTKVIAYLNKEGLHIH